MSTQTSATDHDQALIARIAAGDRAAFELLFREYGERVYRYAWRLISDASKAEEVTNDVMLEVWKTAARYEGRARVSTWILGITRHLALNAVRRKSLDTVDVDETPGIADETQATAALEHDREVLKTALAGALSRLSTDHRDVMELTFYHGCSYQEIAEIVGCPENTVKTRMFHARKQLKALLQSAGLNPDAVEMAS